MRLQNFQQLSICFLGFCSLAALLAIGELVCLKGMASDKIPGNGITYANTNVPLLMTRTPAYDKEVRRILLAEANKLATDLNLPEKIPLTEDNIRDAFVSIPIYVEVAGLGHVRTSNYIYFMAVSNKFKELLVVDIGSKVEDLQAKYCWPISRVNTNAAIAVAKEVMLKAHIDVPALEKQCLTTVWYCPLESGYFSPIYIVKWKKKGVSADGIDNTRSIAYVWFCLPEKKVLDLEVREGQYVLRDSLVVTNTLELLKQTNSPGKPAEGKE